MTFLYLGVWETTSGEESGVLFSLELWLAASNTGAILSVRSLRTFTRFLISTKNGGFSGTTQRACRTRVQSIRLGSLRN